MAKEKVVISPIDNAAMEKTDWSKSAAVAKYFANVGDNMTSAQVWAALSVGYFHMGEVYKAAKANAPPDTVPAFNAYRSARDKRLGKAMPDTTADTYRSVAKSLAEIAFTLPYDGETLRTYFAEKGGSIAYGSRAARFRMIADNFKTEPTREEIEEFVKSLDTDSVNLSSDIVPVSNAVTKWIDDTHSATIGSDDELVALASDLQDALAAFTARANIVQPLPPKSRKSKALSADALALRAKMAAAKANGVTA